MDAAVSRSASPAAADVVSAPDLARLNFAQHHAYLVGIDAYEKVAPLKTAVNDTQRLAELLATQHHFTVHAPLLDARRRGDPRAAAHARCRRRSARTTACCSTSPATASRPMATTGRPATWCPPMPSPAASKRFIPMAELQAALDALPCRHLLLILDCCFSGAFKWSSQHRAIGTLMPKRIYEERFDRFAADPARQIITSAAYDQKALDVLHGKATGDRGARHRRSTAGRIRRLRWPCSTRWPARPT